MPGTDVRIRLSALWVVRTLIGLLGAVLLLFEPGTVERIAAGEMDGVILSGGLLVAGATLMLVPIAMVYLSLTLGDRVNRRANVAVAGALAALDLVGLPANGVSYTTYVIAAGLVVSLLTAWVAWRWDAAAAPAPAGAVAR